MALTGVFGSWLWSRPVASLADEEDENDQGKEIGHDGYERDLRAAERRIKTLQELTTERWARRGKVYKPPWARSPSDLSQDKPRSEMARPAEHWLFGFRDRELERRYLRHAALQGFPQILLAFVTISCLQLVVGILWACFVALAPDSFSSANGGMAGREGFKEGIGCWIMSMLPVLLGLLAVIFIRYSRRVKRKAALFLVTEIAIVLEVVFGLGLPVWIMLTMEKEEHPPGFDALMTILFGQSGWIANASFLYTTYLVFVLLCGMPFAFNLEALVITLGYLFLYWFGMKKVRSVRSVFLSGLTNLPSPSLSIKVGPRGLQH